MHGNFLDLSKKHNIPYGDIQKEWQAAKLDARPKRLKAGTPKFYNFVQQRFAERVEELAASHKEAKATETEKLVAEQPIVDAEVVEAPPEVPAEKPLIEMPKTES